jgi:hypothetical protein
VELNLNGIGADSLPDDIAHSLSQLRTLNLGNCKNLRFLPVSLGSLKALEHVSVMGCTALVHPPKSQRANSSKTAQYLREINANSAMWRRLKVKLLLGIDEGTIMSCNARRRLCFWATAAAARRRCCAHWRRSRCSLTSSPLEASLSTRSLKT